MIPDGVVDNPPPWETMSVSPSHIGIEPGKAFQSRIPFAVQPKHARLRADGNGNSSTGGVCFNVETVPDPLPHHLKKPIHARRKIIQQLQSNIAELHNCPPGDKDSNASSVEYVEENEVHLEALSETTPDTNHKVVYVGGNGFIMAVLTAFAQHLPLILSPDHIWILISYAFAKHVDQHAEELRGNFVQHEGKKRLSVVTPDNFRMSTTEQNPDTGATAQEWESLIFPDFSNQIKDYIGEKIHKAIASEFTTTTSTAKACHEITLMSAMKYYFSCGMQTGCGIPNITLLGEEEDWVNLRARAEQLGTLMTPEFQNHWMPVLLPVLDEFVNSYQGKVNHGFWQSMVKVRASADGSGLDPYVSGWVQILFPYLAGSRQYRRSRHCWYETYFDGPELEEFPEIVSVAPVDWDYCGCIFEMTFNAGILGFTQVQTDNDDASMGDANSGAVCPLLGWYVLHDLPKSREQKLKEYRKELEDLLKGHKEEAAASMEIKEQLQAPWYVRVKYLEEQINSLQLEDQINSLEVIALEKQINLSAEDDDYSV